MSCRPTAAIVLVDHGTALSTPIDPILAGFDRHLDSATLGLKCTY